MYQALQLFGALLVLAGYLGNRRGVLTTDSRAYLTLNILGSFVLGSVALVGHQWGFVVLNFFWVVASIPARPTRRLSRGSMPRDPS